MTAQAHALAQALLDHHKHVRRADADVEASVIAYAELCGQAALEELGPGVGKFLREIAQWCAENSWPPLNSLAVNHHTRRPGRGYDNAPGCSLERWREQARACLDFDGYPEKVS